jgi:hypothetical protein
MEYNVEKALKPYRSILAMLSGISRQLWYIFLPENEQGLSSLEANIVAFRKKEMDREKVISIQKLCGFPLRPNVPLSEMLIKARIQEMKSRKNRDFENDGSQEW